MFLLDALRCILCCGQDEQEESFYSYRINGDYSSINPPIPRSRSRPPDHLHRDESLVHSPAWSFVDSKGNSKLLDVTSRHGDGDRTIFCNFPSPASSSSVRVNSTPPPLSSKRSFAPVSYTNSNISETSLSNGPEKFQIKNNTASQPSKSPYSPISSSAAPAPLSDKHSSIPSSAAPAPSSKNPPFVTVSSTINKFSAVGIPIGSEKLQILPERPGVATLLSQRDSLCTSSSEKDSISPATQSKASSSEKAYLATVSGANSSSLKAPVIVLQEKLPPESSAKRAEKPSLSSPSLPSFRKDAISPAPPSIPPPVHISTTNNSVSLQINKQTSIEPSGKSVQNIPVLSPSLIKVVSPDSSSFSKDTNTSSSKAPVKVWQGKLPIPTNSSTKCAEKPSLSSPSLPSFRKDAISPAPPSIPPLIHISTTNNSVSLQKNKQTSMEPSRKSVQNIPVLSPSLMKVVSPDGSSFSKDTNSSSLKAPVRVWQEKLPIPADSSTKCAEKPSSSSPSLPSVRKDAISPALPSIPSLIHISTTNNSVSLQKNKQTSMEPNRKSVQNRPVLSPSLIKLVSPDSSSSSKSSSPSSSLESGISNLRVLPKFEIPTYLEEMIRNDIVPLVLKRPLSPSTYGDFFATLLYAEDYYIEKWNDYTLKGITLELRKRISSPNSQEMTKKRKNAMLAQRGFVAFEIDSIPEKRPYLLSRDFVFLKPLNEIVGPFKGILYRVVKSSTILVEFGEDFHSQHSPSKRYDVSFSFNRVCLKRAQHAISIASDSSFHSILFPNFPPKTLHLHENVLQFEDHVKKILNHKGPIPYLLNGQHVKEKPSDENFSSTGRIIQAALLSLYKTNPGCRILVCSPTNITSDLLLRSLRREIPVSNLFRANAAYRDYDLVPGDIIPASLYEEDEERFACPPLEELLKFSIITCTFMSSFRLYAAGIDSMHFTHIFLVDASLATEPEAIVPLAHLGDDKTAVVVTGCRNKSPSWVRADIGRRHGLKVSYFHRLLEREPYGSNGSMFISHVAEI